MITPSNDAKPIAHEGEEQAAPAVVMLSGWRFLAGCAVVAALIATVVPARWIRAELIAIEIALAVVSLFLFGSFRYQIHKNALTYGTALVAVTTYGRMVAPDVTAQLQAGGAAAASRLLRQYVLGWTALERLIHIDTMLFILGLTALVAVLSQTRLLETLALSLLRAFRGRITPTLICLCGVVALASGVLDGVSMIGLLLRSLAMILFLAGTELAATRRMMLLCTIVTTVCGMWLAYGEPPNLIMKANVVGKNGMPVLSDGYFLKYCLPLALVSFLVVALQIRRLFGRTQVDPCSLDLMERNSAALRFLQARRHGAVFSEIEILEDHRSQMSELFAPLEQQLHQGHSLGEAMIRLGVEPALRERILGILSDESLAAELDRYFALEVAEDREEAGRQATKLERQLANMTRVLLRARVFGIFGLLAFVALLIWHAASHTLPLFVAPMVGAALAFLGLRGEGLVGRLALRETIHEYAEYLFLMPLFLSISLLVYSGFFGSMQAALQRAAQTSGGLALALLQLIGCTALSAILDNNVVADFTSRALNGLSLSLVYLFSTAQIAGYAVGGCWTHIGSAQSVVAFAFIRRDIDASYTPVAWIKDITRIVLGLLLVLACALTVLALVVR